MQRKQVHHILTYKHGGFSSNENKKGIKLAPGSWPHVAAYVSLRRAGLRPHQGCKDCTKLIIVQEPIGATAWMQSMADESERSL